MAVELSPWMPVSFTEWMPLTQAAALGFATFVQEDIPTVGAALLSGAGRLGWEVGFLGCFLGIWIGDALLYLLARHLGRPWLRFAWVQRFATPESIDRSERWFSQRGPWLLVTSRFVPGSRLPTYLAAGLLRLPFGQFLLLTGGAVAVWTVAIFSLAHFFGARLQGWLQGWNTGAWVLLPGAVAFLLLLRLARRSFSGSRARRIRTWLERWTRWEFWPAWLFYFPVALRYLQLGLRHRGLTLPTAANPGITAGGLVGESKIGTLAELSATSPAFTAEAWALGPLDPGTGGLERRRRELRELIDRQAVGYPFILKPDLGQRGLGVRLVRGERESDAYLAANPSRLVVQRYVPGPLELGIFYYRFPEEPAGRIFAVTEKVFPRLEGDGVRTIEELIWADDRARFVAARYLKRFESRRGEVLPAGTTLRLVEAGNHAQGCVFQDGSRFITPELTARIDGISQRLPGFFIGRYDVRFSSEDELRAGRGFQILELNGAGAEATSIYDARNPVRAAYRTLFRQWELVFAIGAANRARGVRPMPPLELLRTWRAASRLFAAYPPAD